MLTLGLTCEQIKETDNTEHSFLLKILYYMSQAYKRFILLWYKLKIFPELPYIYDKQSYEEFITLYLFIYLWVGQLVDAQLQLQASVS